MGKTSSWSLLNLCVLSILVAATSGRICIVAVCDFTFAACAGNGCSITDPRNWFCQCGITPVPTSEYFSGAALRIQPAGRTSTISSYVLDYDAQGLHFDSLAVVQSSISITLQLDTNSSLTVGTLYAPGTLHIKTYASLTADLLYIPPQTTLATLTVEKGSLTATNFYAEYRAQITFTKNAQGYFLGNTTLFGAIFNVDATSAVDFGEGTAALSDASTLTVEGNTSGHFFLEKGSTIQLNQVNSPNTTITLGQNTTLVLDGANSIDRLDYVNGTTFAAITTTLGNSFQPNPCYSLGTLALATLGDNAANVSLGITLLVNVVFSPLIPRDLPRVVSWGNSAAFAGVNITKYSATLQSPPLLNSSVGDVSISLPFGNPDLVQVCDKTKSSATWPSVLNFNSSLTIQGYAAIYFPINVNGDLYLGPSSNLYFDDFDYGIHATGCVHIQGTLYFYVRSSYEDPLRAASRRVRLLSSGQGCLSGTFSKITVIYHWGDSCTELRSTEGYDSLQFEMEFAVGDKCLPNSPSEETTPIAAPIDALVGAVVGGVVGVLALLVIAGALVNCGYCQRCKDRCLKVPDPD